MNKFLLLFLLTSSPAFAGSDDNYDAPRRFNRDFKVTEPRETDTIANGPSGFYRDHSEAGYGVYMPRGENGAPDVNRMQIIDTYGSYSRY